MIMIHDDLVDIVLWDEFELKTLIFLLSLCICMLYGLTIYGLTNMWLAVVKRGTKLHAINDFILPVR